MKKSIGKARGIILRKTNYSENDIIFEILTEEGTMQGFFARGARKIKSKFSGVLQVGLIITISYTEGKNLHHPSEINIDKKDILTFYTKDLRSLSFFTDVINVTRSIAKDLEDVGLFKITIDALQGAENNIDLLEVYTSYLQKILELINVDYHLKCYFSNQYISEKDFYYIPGTNQAFTKENKPRTISADLIEYDQVFEKQYLQKLVYEHVSEKLKLRF